jgi:hypothetical protein
MYCARELVIWHCIEVAKISAPLTSVPAVTFLVEKVIG